MSCEGRLTADAYLPVLKSNCPFNSCRRTNALDGLDVTKQNEAFWVPLR